MDKNPHAVALGRSGGQATAKKPLSEKQLEARRKNMQKALEERMKKFFQKKQNNA